MITHTTTLGELQTKLLAFGLSLRMYADDGKWSAHLSDPDGTIGRARGASMPEALDAAFANYIATKGAQLR